MRCNSPHQPAGLSMDLFNPEIYLVVSLSLFICTFPFQAKSQTFSFEPEFYARECDEILSFYRDMLPARGTVMLDSSRRLDYELATDKRAAVHAGFLIGFVYLLDDIQGKIRERYTAGYRNFIIGGHSQGGPCLT